MEDKITKRLEKKNAELQRLNDAEERWFKKMIRAAKTLEGIRAERKRLLKPRQLEPHETLKITGEEYTKIRHQDFSDAIPLFYPEQVVSD